MSALTAVRDNLQAGLKAFTIRLGGGNGTLNMGNWVDSNAPGNVYRSHVGSISWAGTHLPYQSLVGPLYHNSAYMACLSAYIDAFPEAPPCIKERNADGQKEIIQDHPLAELFLKPNPYDDDIDLFTGLLIDYLGPGNAYLLPIMNVAGSDFAAFYYLPACTVEPIPWPDPKPGQSPIEYYQWRYGYQQYRIPPEAICHIRYGRDPECPYMGLGRGEILRREIFSDNEATNYTGAILKRFGIGNLFFYQEPSSPDSQMPMMDPDVFVKMITEQTTGDRRGSYVATDANVRVHEFGSSPEKMALDKVRAYPESRVCAVTRVPSQVAMLKCGDEAKTYANYEMARAAFWQDTLLPTLRTFSRKITNQVLWRLPKYQQQFWFGFDYDEVRALQPDRKEVIEAETIVFEHDGMDREEYRVRIGLKPRPEDKGVYYSSTKQPVGFGENPEDAQEQIPPAKMLDATDEGGWLRRISAEYAAMESKNGNGVHA